MHQSERTRPSAPRRFDPGSEGTINVPAADGVASQSRQIKIPARLVDRDLRVRDDAPLGRRRQEGKHDAPEPRAVRNKMEDEHGDSSPARRIPDDRRRRDRDWLPASASAASDRTSYSRFADSVRTFCMVRQIDPDPFREPVGVGQKIRQESSSASCTMPRMSRTGPSRATRSTPVARDPEEDDTDPATPSRHPCAAAQ